MPTRQGYIWELQRTFGGFFQDSSNRLLLDVRIHREHVPPGTLSFSAVLFTCVFTLHTTLQVSGVRGGVSMRIARTCGTRLQACLLYTSPSPRDS